MRFLLYPRSASRVPRQAREAGPATTSLFVYCFAGTWLCSLKQVDSNCFVLGTELQSEWESRKKSQESLRLSASPTPNPKSPTSAILTPGSGAALSAHDLGGSSGKEQGLSFSSQVLDTLVSVLG